MTHGFDDQGRNFDKDGNMNNWWTDEDAAAFKAKTDILVKQFDAIEVLPAKEGQPAIFANGALSLGENIADQLAWSIRMLYEHPALCAEMGAAGAKRAQDFSVARYYDEFVRIVSEIAQNGGTP